MTAYVDPDLVPEAYHEFLLDFNTRYWGLYGGRGSGKTKAAIIKHVLRAYMNKYFRCVYVMKAKDHIRDGLYLELKTAISDLGLSHFFKCYEGDYRIVAVNGNTFIPKGVYDPEKTKGIGEPSHLLIEEISNLSLEEYTTLEELLRTSKTNVQTTFMFNPVDEKHWLRSHFFSPDDRHKPHDKFGDQLKILRTTYKDNNFIDREAYYQTLLNAAALDRNKIRVNIEGDWGVEENDNPWLYAFSEDKHVVDKIAVLRNFPVYISFDFNNDPFGCTAWQFSPDLGGNGSFIHCIKEFSGKWKIDEMCRRIKASFSNHILYVTGDRSGSNEDVGRNKTNYELIAQYLNLSDKQLNLNTKNLEHADSRTFVNALFHNYPRLLISREGCPNLINQCYNAKVNIKSQTPQALLKDRKDHKNDEFDSMRYFFQTYFLKYAQKTYFSGIKYL